MGIMLSCKVPIKVMDANMRGTSKVIVAKAKICKGDW